MHRSRMALLVVFAPVAACSARKDKDPEGTTALSQDSSLAQLDLHQLAAQPQLPDACGSGAATAQPTADDERQAGELTRQAYQAELVGDVRQAHVLLHHAAELDGTSKPIAYHLGRTSEELGDRAGAVNAYCHYLTLSPEASDTGDVRQRLTRLSPSLHLATTRAFSRASRRSAAPGTPRHGYRTASRVASPVRVGSAERTTADGDVTAMPTATAQPSSSTPQPVATSSRRRGGLSHAEGAGIGAAAGAVIAGATGHSVKSAVIGAAAGGLLGALVAGGTNR